jgi:hypothetical protein
MSLFGACGFVKNVPRPNPRLLLPGSWARRPAAGYVWLDGGGRRRPPQQKRRPLGNTRSQCEAKVHRAKRIAGFLVLLLYLAACKPRWRSDSAPTSHKFPRDLVGCYRLLDPTSHRGDTLWYNVMALFQLTAVAWSEASGAHKEWVIRPLSDAVAGMWRATDSIGPGGPSWWADSTSDSIRLSFSDGFSGAAFAFRAPVGPLDTLDGRGEDQWDFGPPFVTGERPARLVRTACPDSLGSAPRG